MTDQRTLTVTLAQLAPIVGDLDGNTQQIIACAEDAATKGTDLVVTPELMIPGYPTGDLLTDPDFRAQMTATVESLTRSLPDTITVAYGTAIPTLDTIPTSTLDSRPRALHNSVIVNTSDPDERMVAHKQRLPQYGVFEDARWFAPGHPSPVTTEINDVCVGFVVCEDIWDDTVPAQHADFGTEVLCVLNASPFHVGRPEERARRLLDVATRFNLTVVYVNAACAIDDLVFDGGSMVIHPKAGVVFRAPQFTPGAFTVNVPLPGQSVTPDMVGSVAPPLGVEEQTWEALTVGVRTYVHNNGFEKVVLGLSGGMDSAVAAVLAADALGPENVFGILMPGPYSSDHSVSDAVDLADAVGMGYATVNITDLYNQMLATQGDLLDGPGAELAKENIQARMRGLQVMTYANTFNALALNTGNKSEAAVGYFTLGGDSMGGFAPLQDVYKSLLYPLAQWRNSHKPATSKVPGDAVNLIPDNTITKPPSAELAPDQVDTNSLPPYDVLDFIIESHLTQDGTVAGIAEQVAVQWGVSDAVGMVRRVVGMIERSEHKRRQVAPGVRVTDCAFWRERRMPLTNRYQRT